MVDQNMVKLRSVKSTALSLTVMILGLLVLPLLGSTATMSFYLKLGAGYGGRSFSNSTSWSFQEYFESGSVNGAYTVDTKSLLIEPGLGFLFTPNVGVELLFVQLSKSFSGTFSSTFPHPLYFDKERRADWTKNDFSYGENELVFSAVGRLPLLKGKLDVYLSAGGSYFLNVQVDALSNLTWNEVGYPFTEINTTPTYENFSKSVFGFNIGGGVDFFFFRGLGANIHFRYASADWNLQVRPGVNISVKPGGFRISAGLKYLIEI